VTVDRDIIIADYFNYVDSLVQHYNAFTPYTLTEHLLVRANPWIIDTLRNTDYYHMIALDSFVYDQKKMIALKEGAQIIIPDSVKASNLVNAFQKTIIDINIPEYKLRIIEDGVQLYEFPIRVGRDEKKYLKMGDRITDLKTKTGIGSVVNHVLDPQYYNPVNGKQYHATKRDDLKTTALPQIPFIETEIEGIRYGQLIHPTTNPKTLGKAYSNGCIGTKEADAWIIYYSAPVGTKVNIRYDLEIQNGQGESMILKDIYHFNKNKL
jgi:L,D-transpeptidase ErfK/SrfK